MTLEFWNWVKSILPDFPGSTRVMTSHNMANESRSSPGYWQKLSLKYSDGTTYMVKLDRPTIERLENGDTKLLETIRANIEATGGALASSNPDPPSITDSLSASSSNEDPPSVTDSVSVSSANNSPPSITDSALASSSNQDPVSVADGALASSSTEENLPKVWGRKETAMLFELRTSMESDFHSMRTHKVLWRKISESMNKKGYKATPTQCENKFKSLKREYRNAVDHNSKSGNDKKSCPFFSEFQDLYGMNASTRPSVAISSSRGLTMDGDGTNTSKTNQTPSKMKRDRKRKERPEWLETLDARQVERHK